MIVSSSVSEPLIIADTTSPSANHDRFPVLIACAAALLGLYAAWFYWSIGLTLSHFDSKAHLVVARRVFDSLTPGWKQLGAVWLPLPHLLILFPVQIDWLYRTGFSALAVSLISFAVLVFAIARLIIQA